LFESKRALNEKTLTRIINMLLRRGCWNGSRMLSRGIKED